MRSTRRFSLRYRMVLVVTFFLLSSSTSLSQQAARPERGAMPNRTYSLTDIESINLQNGNLNLSIPLASLPPVAGGKLSWTVTANYNSKLWNTLRTQADYANDLQWNPYVVDTPSLDGGWRIGGRYVMTFRNSNEDFSRLVYPGNSGLPSWELNLLNNNSYWKMVLVLPDGSEHEFRPVDSSPYAGTQDFLRGYFNVFPNGNATRYYSVDGSYMFARISNELDWTVYMPDGKSIIQTSDGVQRIQDTNGNRIKIFSDANGDHYQDEQTNREVRVTYDPAANGGQGQSRVWYSTVGGIQHHIDINFGTTSVQGKTYFVDDWLPQGGEGGGIVCQRTEELSTYLSVVREIVFPQTEPTQPQQRFTFSYNSDTTESASNPVNWSCDSGFTTYMRQASKGWGELSRMVTPTGSTVDYSYTLDSAHALIGPLDDLSMQSITQKAVTHDDSVDTWTYSISEATSSASVSSPDGHNITETKYCTTSGCATGKAGLVYRTVAPFMMTERHWTNLTFSGANTASPGGILTFNPVADFEYTTLLDSNNSPLKMSARAFQYDYNGNLTQTIEYDWFDPALVSRDLQGVPTGVPAGATVLRVTNNSYYNQASSVSSTNVYAKRSVTTGAPLILNAAQQITSGSGIVQLSYDTQAYGVAPTAGNVTTKNVWADLDNKWITTSNTYDLYGNLATATDARGKVTQFFYDDATHALPNRVVVDPQNGTGSQSSGTAYDFSTGLVISQTDVNGQVTEFDYTNQLLGAADPFGRPGITKSPAVSINGTNQRRLVTTTYLDSARQVIVAADLNAENDKLLKTRTTVDMLGRPVLSESTEDGTNYTISTRNAYLNMGQVTLTSTPMRSTSAATDSWTRVTKDNAGRVTEVATFAGATQPAWSGTAGTFTGAVTTQYSANFTTVTDQAGKVRRSMTDALGCLVRVDEPDKTTGELGLTTAPVQPTSYEYDVFGNLKKVIQGVQQRTFAYDSLSRLRQATNPESGALSYQYDDNGNLLVKTDARGVSTHFEYDALNRVTRRWYNGSNSTQQLTHNVPALPSSVGASDEVKFYYDTLLPPGAPSYAPGSSVGRLAAQTYGSGSNGDYYAYDVLGRPTLKIQRTNNVNYQMTAAYKLSGAVETLGYPSQHTISNTYDQAARLLGFSGNLGDGLNRTYASGLIYSSLGSLRSEQFGTNSPVYHKRHYNSRAQLCDVRASNVNDEWGGELGALENYYSTALTPCDNGADNNGNLRKSRTIVNSSFFLEDRYDYDALNRLKSFNEYQNGTTNTGTQTYDYDRWGNRISLSGSGTGINSTSFEVETATNRIYAPGDAALVDSSRRIRYDLAGNQIKDSYTGYGTATFDAENRISAIQNSFGGASSYSYDGDGKRTGRNTNNQATWQVYGFGGELMAEYGVGGLQKEYGYRNGELLITAEAPASVATTENVSWTNVVGATASGNSLTKTASTAWGNAGASSTRSIVSGDGYVEFRVTSLLTGMVALSHTDANQDYTSMEFALLPNSDGNLYVFESGVNRGIVSSYTTADVFRVAVEGGVVKYRKNGTLVYTSTVAPTYPLLADAGLYHNGGTFSNVVISGNLGGGTTENVSWTNVVGSTASGNSLTKTASTAWGNAGASSTRSIVSGDGYVEFRVTSLLTGMVALSHTDANQDYTSMEFALLPNSDGNLNVFESGVNRGIVSSYTTADVFRVAVEGGVVKYRKNGTLVYTSSVAPSYPLLADAGLYHSGGTFTNVVISGNLGGGTTENVSWTNVVGSTASGNSLTKTASTAWGNAGASSTRSIISGDGYVEFKVTSLLTGMVALSHTDANQDYTSMEFALLPNSDGNLNVFESGVNRGIVSSYTTADVFRVAVEGGVVKYRKNGTLVYTSTVAPSYPLLADAGLYHSGGTFSNVVLSGNLGGGSGGAAPTKINWLVIDHLGTPRIILDQTGNLANLRRHDYLPFGEELFAGTGSRSPSQGYSGGDGVRQHFTSKERDVETGLDYFEARYYSSTQGRFTSPDLLSGRPGSPQSWNRYAYSINNPLKYIDPSGLWWYTKDGGDGHPQWFDDDPGEGYTRFTEYAYYGGAANGYVALDPFSNNFLTGFGSREDATAFSDAMAGQTMLERDPPQDISQLDGTLEVAGYIGGATAAVRIGGLALRGAAAAITARRAAAGAAEEVVGLFGKVSVDALEAAASSSGPTVQIVTKLTQFPQAGRALSVATGEGAEALANAARSTGQLYRANVPQALLGQLERSGLAIRSTTQMAGSNATAIEYRFLPQATRFITSFFKE